MKTSILLLPLAFMACQPARHPSADTAAMRSQADTATSAAQQALLQKVSQAIAAGGPAHAVDFCNTNAIPLTDSLSGAYQLRLQRISDRNRNPANRLQSPADSLAFALFQSGSQLRDTLLQQEDGRYVYYKRIHIAMPTCLKCHGEPGSDIDARTLQQLQKLYPADHATHYRLHDFRGLWKVSFADAR